MSYANLARPVGPFEPTFRRTPEGRCGMAPHRGDVTTVRAAAFVRLRETKRIEKRQSPAPSHRTAGTAAVAAMIPRIGRA